MKIELGAFYFNIVLQQPPAQALRFSHGRGECETRVTGDEPQPNLQFQYSVVDVIYKSHHPFFKSDVKKIYIRIRRDGS